MQIDVCIVTFDGRRWYQTVITYYFRLVVCLSYETTKKNYLCFISCRRVTRVQQQATQHESAFIRLQSIHSLIAARFFGIIQ